MHVVGYSNISRANYPEEARLKDLKDSTGLSFIWHQHSDSKEIVFFLYFLLIYCSFNMNASVTLYKRVNEIKLLLLRI